MGMLSEVQTLKGCLHSGVGMMPWSMDIHRGLLAAADRQVAFLVMKLRAYTGNHKPLLPKAEMLLML